MIQGILRLGLSSAVAALALATTAFAASEGATAHFCGAGRCIPISKSEATKLSQRNESFSPASAPRPAPFYRIKVKGTGEGYISRTIIWVPSRKLWFSKDYVTPPLPGDWRTETTNRELRRLARMTKLFPAPARWARVLPR